MDLQFDKEFAGNYGTIEPKKAREYYALDPNFGVAVLYQYWKRKFLLEYKGQKRCRKNEPAILVEGTIAKHECKIIHGFETFDIVAYLKGNDRPALKGYSTSDHWGRPAFIQKTWMPISPAYKSLPLRFFDNWGGEVADFSEFVRTNYSDGHLLGLARNDGQILIYRYFRNIDELKFVAIDNGTYLDDKGLKPNKIQASHGIDIILYTSKETIEQDLYKDDVRREQRGGESESNEQPKNEPPDPPQQPSSIDEFFKKYKNETIFVGAGFVLLLLIIIIAK